MGNSLLAVRDINHKYIVVERRKARMKKPSPKQKDVLNPEEAVRYFGFSRRKFFGMLREGKGNFKSTLLYTAGAG